MAEEYKSNFDDVNSAVDAFFNYPLRLSNKKRPSKGVINCGGEFLKIFEKHLGEKTHLDGDELSPFMKEVGIPEDGFYLYVMSYLGETKEFGNFSQMQMKAFTEKIVLTGAYQKDIEDYFNKEIQKQNHKFLMFVHQQLKVMIFALNKEQNKLDTMTEKQMNVSFRVREQGKTEFVDMLNAVYQDVLLSEIYNSPVFPLFLNFVKDVKKRLSISKDEFSYITDFIREFNTIKKLKISQDVIDEKVYLPQLYQDFLEFVNTKPSKK
ncbi:hypothetical protein EIN_215110 [Entamoeba invadens IP1]|uniref:Uncharacterized protein n=1 Tax=Entamoeba invadens IP1 TaxID=370355 RepID=A0A0A1U7J3_ENTIV|nr:hypothetical protein EIN_215110 [Entamoeba invadens IP1]ELP90358.1 hypothetical protein EIN_215110 [Entamoeba invadens IP1]|eukprot:XP_004257129.1 hypothetical protein EIN_215110 [Entamoeba invadens IP1]